MALTSGLSLVAYTTVTPGAIGYYGDAIAELTFTTVAPGGFGDLHCQLKVPNARLIPPELRPFAYVALVGGNFTAFQGRWDEPGIELSDNSSDGELMPLAALGASSVMKDDPDDQAYSNQTAQSIISNEIARRAAYLPLDQDTSQILPNNPSATFSPAWNAKNLDDEINELLPILGDYQWAVWNHATHTDAAGFPTWQLYWHKRDLSTISYTGFFEDESGFTVRPAVEYSYNVVTVKYRDSSTNAPSIVTVKDSRLAGSGAQGSAPFPWRRLSKDLSGYHLSGTQATAVANALLAEYMNGGYKNEVHLTQVRDANGQEIPLWQVRADANIFLPQLSPIGTTLPTVPTAGTNLFYITETEYSEASGNAPTLTLTLDSFSDKGGFAIARLQYQIEHPQSDAKHHHHVHAAGEQYNGYGAVTWPSNAVAGDVYASGIHFGTHLTNTPSSITITTRGAVNDRGAFYSDIQNTGFDLNDTVNVNGSGFLHASWVTVGA